jgi:soluble lytic murein transglycosylase-like protein
LCKLLASNTLASKLIRIAMALAAIVAATPVAAHAQIYTWRDATGNLVLSDKPKDGTERAYAVTSGDRVLTTRPIVGRRTTEYDGLIEQHSTLHGVRADLVRAVIHAESAFNPFARSIKGAMGLMQLMPATAASYKVSDAYNPAENIRAGVAYLKSLLTRFSQNEELALAAYNAGPGAVMKYGGVVPPYRETRDYVKKIRNEAGARPAPTRVYRIVEMKDGRETVRFTNVPPAPAILAGRTGRAPSGN